MHYIFLAFQSQLKAPIPSPKTTLWYFAGYSMTQAYRYTMALMDVFVHPPTLAPSRTRSKPREIIPRERNGAGANSQFSILSSLRNEPRKGNNDWNWERTIIRNIGTMRQVLPKALPPVLAGIMECPFLIQPKTFSERLC